MTQRLIALAGFRDAQIATLAQKFLAARFVAVDDKDVADANPDALVSLTETALDALFVPKTLERCSSLKWVHASSAGIDNYLPHLHKVGFTLTCGKVIQGPNVADHALALLLALTRRLPWYIRGAEKAETPRPTELYRKRALVVGFGGIGMSIAERCAAFGMRVDCVTETLMPMLSFVEKVYLRDQLLDALPTADVVFVSLPATPASHGIFNDAAFAAMKKDAYLVNTSRGTVIDTEALVRALNAERLEGVGLDVTEPEPLPGNHALRAFDRVIVTPHVAGMTTTVERRFELVETNIRRFLDDLPLINVVDPELGF